MELSKAGKIMNSITEIEFKTVGLYRHWTEKHDLSFEMMMLLYALIADENVTQKKIVEKCQMPKQTVSGLIKVLENKGFVKLIQSKTDKREKVIKLTPEGEKYCFEMINPLSEINDSASERIGVDFINKLLEDLKLYYHSIEMAMELADVSDKWKNVISGIKAD